MHDNLFPPMVHGLASPTMPPGWPITVTMFWEMVRHDILEEKDPVYLWRGHLARRPTPVPEHSCAVKSLYDHFTRLARDSPHSESQVPVNMTREDSVLIPDAAIVRGRMHDYAKKHPVPADFLLVAEVLDMPHEHLLAEVYAAEGIPIYWEVSLAQRRVTVHHEPEGSIYLASRVFGTGDEVPIILNGREVGRVPVADLFPRRTSATLGL